MKLVRRSLTVICVVMLAAGAAACGSSSSSGGSTTTGATSSQTLSVSSTASPTDSGGSGGSDSDFCATAKEQSKKLEGELTGAINPSSTPASTKALFTKVDEAYTTLANEAPSDIKPALLTVSGIFHQMDQVFAANGYSSTKALAKLEPIITSAKFKTAVAQLKTWGETHHCTTSG